MSIDLSNASCIIKTKASTIGFPRLFSHCPKGMPEDMLTIFHKYVSNALDDIEALADDDHSKVRRVVICENGYLLLGVACYLNSLMDDEDAELYNAFCDNFNRRIQGFVGFVWDLKSKEQSEYPQGFPKNEAYKQLLQMKILPHWNDSENSFWAESYRSGIQEEYNLPVVFDERTDVRADNNVLKLNEEVRKVAVFSVDQGDAMINIAIDSIVISGKRRLSACTNLSTSLSKTVFMNITSKECAEEGMLYDNYNGSTISKDPQNRSISSQRVSFENRIDPYVEQILINHIYNYIDHIKKQCRDQIQEIYVNGEKKFLVSGEIITKVKEALILQAIRKFGNQVSRMYVEKTIDRLILPEDKKYSAYHSLIDAGHQQINAVPNNPIKEIRQQLFSYINKKKRGD